MIFRKIRKAINSFCFWIRLNKHGKKIRVSRYNFFEGLKNITIGSNFSAADGFWLATYKKYCGFEYTPEIKIGDNVHLSRNCHIGAINKIIIEDNVLIGSNVLINDHSHGESMVSETARVQMRLISKGPIVIKKNVWLGDNVCVMPNVEIGENCIIGANSVVTKNIPANSMAVGVPAKVIKTLN